MRKQAGRRALALKHKKKSLRVHALWGSDGVPQDSMAQITGQALGNAL